MTLSEFELHHIMGGQVRRLRGDATAVQLALHGDEGLAAVPNACATPSKISAITAAPNRLRAYVIPDEVGTVIGGEQRHRQVRHHMRRQRPVRTLRADPTRGHHIPVAPTTPTLPGRSPIGRTPNPEVTQ